MASVPIVNVTLSFWSNSKAGLLLSKGAAKLGMLSEAPTVDSSQEDDLPSSRQEHARSGGILAQLFQGLVGAGNTLPNASDEDMSSFEKLNDTMSIVEGPSFSDSSSGLMPSAESLLFGNVSSELRRIMKDNVANISSDCWTSVSAGLNGSDCFGNVTGDILDGASSPERSEKVYWALVLVLLPFLAVFGNILVILSVYKERTLQSVTNYFIVSLAFADLLVAGVVMPFAVYFLVSPDRILDFLCASPTNA